MRAAENFYTPNENFKVLDDELIVKYDSRTVAEIWSRAEKKRLSLDEAYEKYPRGIRKSLSKIIPYMALYKTLLDDDPSDAYELIAEQSKMNAIRDRKSYVQLAEKNPGNVVKMITKTLRSEYGEKFGYKIIAEEKEKKNIRVRIVENPVEPFCSENGCPELARIFYDRISYLLSNLPGLLFKIGLEKSNVGDEPEPESESESESENVPESESENLPESESEDEFEDNSEPMDESVDEPDAESQTEIPKSSTVILSLSVRPA